MNDLLSLREKRFVRIIPKDHLRIQSIRQQLIKMEGFNVTAGEVVSKALDLLEKKVSK